METKLFSYTRHSFYSTGLTGKAFRLKYLFDLCDIMRVNNYGLNKQQKSYQWRMEKWSLIDVVDNVVGGGI